MAARELEKLKQGNRDFSRYFADFARLVRMIPDTSANPRRRALEKGPSSELQDPLKHQDIPTDETLAGFVDCLKRVDERIRRPNGQSNKPRHLVTITISDLQ